MDFRLSTRQQEQHVILMLDGELDMAWAGYLVDRVEEILREGSADLRADLGSLRFCDSSGLAALLRVKRLCQKAGGSFRVFGATGSVAYVLKVTGLDAALDGHQNPALDPGLTRPQQDPEP